MRPLTIEEPRQPWALATISPALGPCQPLTTPGPLPGSYEGVEETVPYASRFRDKGKDKESARLQRPQPSLMPPPRATSAQTTSLETREHVNNIFTLLCPTSPHQKDARKRHLGRHVVQTLQAMIQTLPLDEIYRVFVKTYPMDKLGFTQFKLLRPWNVIKAYRETCLCRICELFRLFMQALHIVARMLKPLVSQPEHTNDGEGDDAQAEAAAAADDIDPQLEALVRFCSLELKSLMVQELICGGCLSEAKPVCVDGKCTACGFAKLWSRGLRPKIVNMDKKSPKHGELLDGVPTVWEQEVRYEVLKSSGLTPSDGSNTEEKETLRAQRTSSLVEFLDAFEEASVKFPAHRHLVGDAKAKAMQRDRGFWPGMLLSDYDWSENGVIGSARQIQSEYWSLTHYSLFISITSYLIVETWLNRSSILSEKTAVTVEPEDAHVQSLASESFKPAKGSFYGEVHASPGKEGEDQVYSVTVYGHPEKPDGTVIGGVLRSRLRHRKKHTTAFVGITDEKRHDAPTTQHMLNKQFEYWLLHLDETKFWAWLGHSDNATHFKSGAMLNYWSGRMSKYDFLKACWIDFGCPGHGKGPWDGMGAVMKQQVSRDITNGRVLTESGYIRDPCEVAEQLEKRFQTDEWRMAHTDKAIHEIIVTYSHHNEITERGPVEHEFESLTGQKSSFSFNMLAQDQIARRGRSCFCHPCLSQLGRATLTPVGNGMLQCEECESDKKLATMGVAVEKRPSMWHEQTVKDKGTGLAGRRVEAQTAGKEHAKNLKASGFLAIQARERWSTKEVVHYRPGHFWLAQASDVLEVRRVTKRETHGGQPFAVGDYLVRIGRYFDRMPSDLSGLSFEEWQPERVFSPNDVGSKLTISAKGVIKVGSTTRDAYWGTDEQPAALSDVTIIAVDDAWIKYGRGRNDKFCNPRIEGGFVINATELRLVNFSMEPIDAAAYKPRTSGRRAAAVSAPKPKKYRMAKEIDHEIRAACW